MRLNFSKWPLVYKNGFKSAYKAATPYFTDGLCVAAETSPPLRASIPLGASTSSGPTLTNINLHWFAAAIDII